MAALCAGRVVIITGAGRGVGRGHALEFARQGAKVVVNDLGGGTDGSGRSSGPAHEVVLEIRAMGREAIANTDDVSDYEAAGRLVQSAIDTFGRLDVLVNNAGILRDRMLANMSPEEWDDVVRVHLRGTFATSRHAAAYWRDQSKAGEPVDARLINTSSASGIYGNPGQTNYAAAKAGIAAFTVVAAMELERYGVTVNAVYPSAMTRLVALVAKREQPPAGSFNPLDPDNVAPLVVWLGSSESREITGRVFGVGGGRIAVAEGWHPGPKVNQDKRWDPSELGPVVRDLVARARPNAKLFDEYGERMAGR
jgi:NAD(P)-dependent dehydrogenase (short-subunit alcohol dehydrogenase family)